MVDAVPPIPAQQMASLQSEVHRLRHELATVQAKAREDRASILAAAQHRVRNMLAVVRAILSHTVQPGTSAEDFAAHLKGRVDTLVRLHGVLTRSPTGRIDLEEMVREEILAQGGLASPVVIDGPSVALPGKAAEVLGLAIHELAANSIKFGALATDSGHVDVGWSLGEGADATRLSIRWVEAGTSIAEHGPRGFGRELIEDGLPYQLDAETAFELRRDGFVCSIVLSIDNPGPSSWAVLSGGPGP